MAHSALGPQLDMRIYRTLPAHGPHSVTPTNTGAVRRVSVPVPPAACTFVLAPRRLRVPTSPPQQDKRARSGTLHLCYTSKQTTGETNPETYWGKPGTPPAPKTRPGSRFSPRPPFLPPHHDTTHRAHDRGKCTAPAVHTAPHLPDEETCKGTGGTREPPKARFPGSPGPPPALPRPEGALRAPSPTRIPRRPGHHGNQQPGRRHPARAHGVRLWGLAGSLLARVQPAGPAGLVGIGNHGRTPGAAPSPGGWAGARYRRPHARRTAGSSKSSRARR